jgi:hypothetical protein
MESVSQLRRKAHQNPEALVKRIIMLETALSKAIDYCDRATHIDEQYHDERGELIRRLRNE